MHIRYEYYGIVLDAESHKILKNKFVIPLGWKTFAHHTTILHRSRHSAEVQEWAEAHLGEVVTLTVTKWGTSDKAMAVEVTGDFQCINAHPHITIATSPTGKAVDSNFIEDWLPTESFTLTGKITRF